MSDRLDAEICVVLKTLPTREAVNSLANKLFEELKNITTNSDELESTFLYAKNTLLFKI